MMRRKLFFILFLLTLHAAIFGARLAAVAAVQRYPLAMQFVGGVMAWLVIAVVFLAHRVALKPPTSQPPKEIAEKL